MSLPGLGLPGSITPMRSTEIYKTDLGHIYPGLSVVDKFHPQNSNFPNPSYEQIIGFEGQQFKDFNNTLVPKTPIK
jgi:hypothetical protein